MYKKSVTWAFSLIFMIMLILPLLHINFKPDVVSEIENRKLVEFPVLYNEEGEKNNHFIADFESWFNDNIGMREDFFVMNSEIQYGLFQTSPNQKVTVGEDGWLFCTESNNIELAVGGYPAFDEKDLEELCRVHTCIKNILEAQGIEYVIFCAPSKATVYPEYIRGDFGVTKTPADIFADYMEAHSDVKVIRVKDALIKEKEKKQTSEELYFKTDSHWNAYGAYTAYKEIVNKLNEWGIISGKPADITYVEATHLHDLAHIMVKPDEKYHEKADWAYYEVKDKTSWNQKDGEKNEAIQSYVSRNHIRQGDYYLNTNQESKSFLVFGDSMYMRWLTSLMAENCSELTAIWSYEMSQEIIDIVSPDVVVCEMTERNINQWKNYNKEFMTASMALNEDNQLNITYCDYGKYDNMWFPTWSEENGQDDLVWYEAKREDDWMWCVQVDLNKHKTNGKYVVHYYQGDDIDSAQKVGNKTYDVGNMFH